MTPARMPANGARGSDKQPTKANVNACRRCELGEFATQGVVGEGPDGGLASAPGSADNIDVVPSTSVSPQAPLRAWRDTDIEAVLGINAASQPHVARLDRAEVRRLLVIGARIWVVTGDGDEVIAYLIAFPSDAPYDGQEFAYFTGRLGGGFLYVDQVAIHPQHRRGGLGRALYEHVVGLARAERLRALCCEVNLVPPNPDSRLFHARAGFVAVDQLELPDGRTVELLTRGLAPWPERVSNADV